jgi:NAD(P)-dependent dehydrogenase (short-subunit alcohol dehydrogenase family)
MLHPHGYARRATLYGAMMLAMLPWMVPARSAAQGTADDDAPMVALVTGSTGGLGREVARALAARGVHVIVHGRNEERGLALVAEIEATGVGSARFYRADLASFDEVRTFAGMIRRDYDRLDVLVNNAGVWLDSPERQLSADGHEMHFQVNYLSSFLLTYELLPLLIESAPARVVNVSSVAQRPIDFADVMLDEGYNDGRAYAQSKLAQIMFTIDLAGELTGRDVAVVAVHPASMMDTDMVLERGARPRSSVQEGTEAVMRAITSDDVRTGEYYRGLELDQANAQAYDAEARARLRRLSRELTGIS